MNNQDSYPDATSFIYQIIEDFKNPPNTSSGVSWSAPPEEAVESPNHYRLEGCGVEAIDVIQDVLTGEEFSGYLYGNVLKYLLRANKKGGGQDFQKAYKYLGWYISHTEGEE